jgi:type II secretory pathway component PulK
MDFGFGHLWAARGRHVAAGRRARGTVLIVTMWILLVLAGLVLVLGRAARVEGDRSANGLAEGQAAAVEEGAIQYVLARVDGLQGQTPPDADTPCEAVQVGDGAFWILRPTSDDNRAYSYGITDEAAKVNLNTATLDMLSKLPGMTPEFAASIVDWRDADSNVTPGGAESEYYLMLPDPYECKNSPLETVEELFLIRGASKDILYGGDTSRNGILDPGEETSFITSSTSSGIGNSLDRGLFNDVTVYSGPPAANTANATTGSQPQPVNVNTAQGSALTTLLQGSVAPARLPVVIGRIRRERPFLSVFDFYYRSGLTFDEFQPIASRVTTTSAAPPKGLINVNTAPREVLLCLPKLDDSDVSSLLAQRPATSTGGLLGSGSTFTTTTTGGSTSMAGTSGTDISWVVQALSREKAIAIGGYVTGRSYQFSADIVSVAPNGRAFKRCRVVIDARSSPPKVIYRQNLTHLGWPLSPDIVTRLRSGMGLDPVVQTIGQGAGSS